jgi:hypothetical protein
MLKVAFADVDRELRGGGVRGVVVRAPLAVASP